ncbi:MAG: BamA/TamA family outer membrane protein [Bacteroidales bacterium]|jgi:outer membrane protein assembly factor BamA|nr:BamA/TamA family outer membrane protein [Bacteroidales bacterium]
MFRKIKWLRVTWIFIVLFLLHFAVFGKYRLLLQYIDNSVEADKITKTITLKKYYRTPISIERHLQKLVLRLHNNGFNSAALDTIIVRENICIAQIYVGKKMIISQIIVDGMEKEEIQALKIKPSLSNSKVFSIEDVFLYSNKIATKLWNTGYPFATAKIEELVQQDSGYIATIAVEKNNFIVLDSMIIAGNLRLGKSFLYGYLGLKRRKAYNEHLMQQVPARIQELEFVNVTQPPGISFSDREAALYIYANKQKTNQFDGYLGIVPNDEVSGKVLLTGMLNLNLNNVLTAGENLRFNWQRIQVLSQNLDIYVDFPYLFYSSFGIDGEFMLEKRDTSYINLNFSVGIRYYLQQRNYIRAYYQFRNARLIAHSGLEYLSILPVDIDYNSHLYGLEIVFYKLDYFFNPRKGYAFSFSTAIGQRLIIKNNNIMDSLYKDINLSSMQVQLNGKFDIYFPIKNRWVWYVGLKAGHIQATQLFENEIFRIGGLKTIRGFDEQSIYASTYGILNNELRFIFSKKSYIQLFFDIAWYERKLNRMYLSDLPLGFGAGISFDTKAGIFSFNYALGKQLNNPVRFNTGKITFGYTALF